MRFSSLIAGFVAFTWTVSAQQQMPDCATKCLVSSLEAQSVCSPTDTVCICTNEPLNAAIKACVGQTCTIKNTLTAVNVTATMCQAPVRDQSWIPTLVASVTGGAALLAVLLRTGDAIFNAHFGWDDGCAAAAGFFVILMNAMQMPIGNAGFGRDVWTVPFANIVFILKMVWLTQIFYWPISAFTKLSFLFFYLRIFPRRELRKYIYATMGLTFCYWAGFQFGNIFYCHPISMVWNAWDGEHEGSCLSINTFMIAASAVNIAIDIIIIIIPIPELLNLNLSLRKKIGVVAIFMVGTFTLIVSCLRIERVLSYAKSQNPTWDNIPADYWSIMEANLGVFCVCMPSLRRLLAHGCPVLFGSTRGQSNKYSYSNDTPMKSSKRSRGRTPTVGGSLWTDTAITKTVDATVTYGKRDSEDEIELVSQKRESKNAKAETRSVGSGGTLHDNNDHHHENRV